MNSEKLKKDKLREKAEEILQNQFNPVKDQSENDDYIHELRVHQIELEIQNQELQAAQIKLEDSRRKYFDLYNFAPVGYFTLDKDGIILDVNLAGATLLGVERLNLQKRAFIQYIDPDFRNNFHHHIMNVLENGHELTVNIKLLKMNGSFYAHLETLNVLDNHGNFKEFRMTVSDINELKNTEEALKEIKHNLELKVEERTQELRFANEYNRSLIEASLDPLVTIGPDGKITDVNNSTEKFTGLTRNELIGTDFSDYFTEPKKAKEGYLEVFREGFVRDYPLEMKHKDGRVIPVLYNASVYKNENDEVIGVYAAARDITQLKKAEEEIRKLANIVESSDDAIISTTLEGVIVSWNRGAKIIYGYSANEVIGKNITMFAPTALKDEIKQFFENIIRGERVFNYERPRLRKDGKKIYLSLTLSPIFDTYEKLIGISIIGRDITERKNAEKELEFASKYNRSLIEASVDPLVTIGPDGKITDVNNSTESVTGYSREDLIGNDFSDYFTEPEKAREGYQQVFQEGTVLDYPLEIKNKNGDITPVVYNASVYRDDNNRVIGVFAAARDITERKKAENKLKEYQDTLEKKVKERTKALEQSNKELKEFAYVASHDLKEPLRMITSFLQLLELRYKDKLDPDANDFIEFAVEGAKRMDKMINDLLEYSRIGNQEREFEYLQSEKLLETVLMNLKSAIEDTNALITHDPLPLIFANEQMMIHLFQNLISNSIKYHGEKNPEIHISADNVNDEYIFAIKDNGIGIDENHLERIFTIFQRLHTREEYEGTGIGLAIVQKIVQKHRGKIWVKSGLGKGTTFYFTIPNQSY